MEINYNTCSTCYFSVKTSGIKINKEFFCSVKCLPKCFICNEKKNDIIYCETNSCYFCFNCSLKRCKYCYIYSDIIKCKCKSF